MHRLWLIALVIVAGCSFKHVTLESRWAPLERIQERPKIPGLSNTAITTIYPRAYVVDLDKWLLKHPIGSPRFDAIMRHEQEHAKRQKAHGVFSWIAKYLYDKDFAYTEEQLGWYWEIITLRQRGQQVNVDGVAAVLSKYKNLTGSLVSFTEAKKWVQDVLSGRWKPPQ